MKRTIHQSNQLHAIIGKLKLPMDVKVDLVQQFTNGRETSTKEMTFDECQRLINHLNAIQVGAAQSPTKDVTRSEERQKADRMRKKFLSTCYDLKWTIKGQLDWTKINEWLDQYGYLHKPLNAYKLEELPKLVTQIETMLSKDYAKR